MDHFNQIGVCPSCGAALGTLKGSPPPTFNQRMIYKHDTIIYHMHPIMQKALIKCEKSSKGS